MMTATDLDPMWTNSNPKPNHNPKPKTITLGDDRNGWAGVWPWGGRVQLRGGGVGDRHSDDTLRWMATTPGTLGMTRQ